MMTESITWSLVLQSIKAMQVHWEIYFLEQCRMHHPAAFMYLNKNEQPANIRVQVTVTNNKTRSKSCSYEWVENTATLIENSVNLNQM